MKKLKNIWLRLLKALGLYSVRCRFHRWKYVDNGLTRICKICECTEITVGEIPSSYRLPSDVWVRTYDGNGN